MKQEGRKKIATENILDNKDRRRIYLFISEKPNLSITQLEQILKIKRDTLKHHLSLLIRHNLIRKEQQKNLPGKPVVFYRTINSSTENLLIESAEDNLNELLSSLGKRPLLESELKNEKLVRIISKRNSRGEVILDKDDLVILCNLNKKPFLFLDELKKSLNISHKGLLIHLKRLQEHGFIFKNRSKDNYKIKIISISQTGEDILRYFKHYK